MITLRTVWRTSIQAVCATLIVACGGGGGGESASLSGGDVPPPSGGNSKPTISGTPPTQVVAGAAYSFTPSASDADGDTLTFSITNKPDWASFNVNSGSLTGTPSSADVGTTSGVIISVSDGQESSALPSFNVTVSMIQNEEVNVTIVKPDNYLVDEMATGKLVYVDRTVTFTDLPSAFQGMQFIQTANDDKFIVAADATTFMVDQPVTVYVGYDVLVGSLPGWLQSWEDTQEVIVTSDTSFRVYSRGFDAGQIALGGNEFGFSMYTVLIAPAAAPPVGGGNSPPSISGTPPTRVTEGNPYSFAPTATDADGDALTFSVANLPGWASFDDSNGSISGTPGTADVGTYTGIVISVTDGLDSSSLPAFQITVAEAGSGNSPPTISGSPATSVTQDNQYTFTPVASDSDGDSLSFTISNRPAWASFDSSNGTLSGTPGTADVGTYAGIVISVTDGSDTASLPAFDITVVSSGAGTGSASLSWTAPTRNEDGTPLDDLAGYKVYYGNTSGSYTEIEVVNNSSLTSYVVNGLASGEWYFAVTAFDLSGNESGLSNEAFKAIP